MRTFVLSCIALSPLSLRAQEPAAEVRCETVDLAADEMVCERERCILTGAVALSCEDLKLWSQTAEIRLAEGGRFAGALAQGDVLVVEGRNVITCESLFLGPDRISGRIDAATVRVRQGKELSPEGIPQGRDRAVFSGTLERKDERRLHIDDATFTLCDCGNDAPPSWSLHASSIDATLEDRATIHWPVLWVNPLGLGTLVPLPLTVPWLSVPLTPRAAGFLPPKVAFFQGSALPTIDVPFFLPLGESYDLTLQPGVRTDWVEDHRLTPPTRWGALRLGGRARYAPVADTVGAVELQWTHDRYHGAAKRLETQATNAPPYQRQSPDWDLEERLVLRAKHRSLIAEDTAVTADVVWFSDDAYLRDFGVAADERKVGYVPSRAQAAARGPSRYFTLAADYLQHIDVRATKFNKLGDSGDYSNLSDAELRQPHRGPYVLAHLSPIPLVGGLHAQAEASFVRYGAWLGGVAPLETVAGGGGGLSYLTNLGPLRMSARANLDSLWVEPGGESAIGSTALLTGADLDLPLGRQIGGYDHIVTPRLSYRGIPWRTGAHIDARATAPERIEEELPPIDERLRRDHREHQMMLTLDQALWESSPGSSRSAVGLVLSQPYDLRHNDWLASFGELRASGEYLAGGIFASYDGPTSELRELGVRAGGDLGPLEGRISYARWSPESGRFLRSIYELQAPRDRRLEDATWVHYVGAGIAVEPLDGLRLGYSGSYNLRLPEPEPDPNPAQGFTKHAAELSYTSPCDCWGAEVSAKVDPTRPDPWSHIDFHFEVTMGGYDLGSQP